MIVIAIFSIKHDHLKIQVIGGFKIIGKCFKTADHLAQNDGQFEKIAVCLR